MIGRFFDFFALVRLLAGLEVGTGVAIVHEKTDIVKTLFFCVFLENLLLRRDLSRGILKKERFHKKVTKSASMFPASFAYISRKYFCI